MPPGVEKRLLIFHLSLLSQIRIHVDDVVCRLDRSLQVIGSA
jgi:hypothetical protein